MMWILLALALLALLALLVAGGSLGISRLMVTRAEPKTHALDDAPAREVVLVLGARVHGDRPSNMLEDRLAAALALYESGRAQKLILSGAHHRDDYDEVTVMRRWLEDRGVPPDDLYLDHAGLRTLDSMVRAREVFGVERLAVVSQDFHLPRAVYLGEQVGMDTIAVVAPAGYRYTEKVHRYNAAREHLARTRAWLDLHLLGTPPRHGGPPIDLGASGRATH